MAALRLIVEALRDGVVDPAKDAGILDQMMLHVRHLSDLLDDPLHARETRYEAVIARPVRIESFLEQWSDAMRPKAELHGIDLSLDVASALPDIECRVAQVARVLLNLIDNAVRHTPAGGSVVVRALAHPGGVQNQVNDTGPGLTLPRGPIRSSSAIRRSRSPGRDDAASSSLGRSSRRAWRQALGRGGGARSQRALLPAGDRQEGRLSLAPARGELLHHPRHRRAGRRRREAREHREAYVAHRTAVERARDDARMYRCQRELGNERDPAAGGDDRLQ